MIHDKHDTDTHINTVTWMNGPTTSPTYWLISALSAIFTESHHEWTKTLPDWSYKHQHCVTKHSELIFTTHTQTGKNKSSKSEKQEISFRNELEQPKNKLVAQISSPQDCTVLYIHTSLDDVQKWYRKYINNCRLQRLRSKSTMCSNLPLTIVSDEWAFSSWPLSCMAL